MKTHFEILGFYKEIVVDGKFVGTIRCENEEGRPHGYNGRQYETLDADIITDRKVKVKKGTTINTSLFPICGRIIYEAK
jgi:hypothetical protein